MFVLLFVWAIGSAQSERDFETDTLILNRLEKWQDLKFGFMAHWGIYAQWGIVESWSICNEPWIDRGGVPYNRYVADYWALNKTFNPQGFDASEWAQLAQDAGMRYVVFTTKHHDGFCMFKTAYTGYSVADASCPYSQNAQPDITKSVVDAFRAKNFWCGLYFSKPDWHNADYWAPEWATPDRNVNYAPADYPERWNRFKQFTYNQIEELTSNYGDIDILWLDGGWVRPEWSLTDESRPWLGCKGWIQDVDLPKIASMARRNNPDLLIVDRSVHGKYENYRTPEKQVPDSLLPYPWETCMTLGNSWSYEPDDEYKSVNTLVHMLVDVVAKGGNLLLNVGPNAEGKIPQEAIERFNGIGKWMRINGNAIYATRPVYPYTSGNLRFTQAKNGVVNIFYLLNEDEVLPESIVVEGIGLKSAKATVLGCPTEVKIVKNGRGYVIQIPAKLRRKGLFGPAVCFVVG